MTETDTLIEPNSKQEKKQSSFEELISKFKAALKTVYHDENDINQMSTSRGIAPEALKKILLTNPHTLLIPREYGGGGGSAALATAGGTNVSGLEVALAGAKNKVQ